MLHGKIWTVVKKFKKMCYLVLFLTVAGLLFLILPIWIAAIYSQPKIFPSQNAPKSRVAIVFGAGLMRDGSPTLILRDRVATAADLYFSGKVEKLLMSGDNRFVDYNEPGSMRAFAISLGVPEKDIVLDYAGRRTYDTCFRARDIFGVQEAILVSQEYHLSRAVLTCNALGVKAYGVIADRREYRLSSYNYWRVREMPATLVAFWEVWVAHPVPVLGTPEPIFPSGPTANQPQK